jgi:WD40 repeat protein
LAAYYNNPIVTGAGDFRIAHSNTPFNLFHVPEALTLATPAAFNYSNTLFADTADNVIRLWRLHKAGGHDTASFLAELKGNDDLLTAMAFAPDGRLAAADASGTIRLWYPNLASTAVANQATQIAFSPTNDQVAWLENGQLYMQAFDDFTAGITVTTVYTGYDVRLNSLAFSPDGSRIAAGGGPVTGRGVVYIWQTADPNNPVIVLEGHTQPVQSIAFSPDGAVLASGSGLGEYNSGDDTVLIWDLENPAIPSHRLTAHIRMITKLLFAPDGTLLASASAGGTVRLWSTNDYSGVGEALSVAANERVLSLAFSNDSSQIVAGSDNITARPVAASGRIYLWALNDLSASPRILLAQNSYGVNDLAFSPDGSLLVSATADGLVRLWQFEGALPTSLVLVGYGRGVKSVAFARDGRLVSADGQIVQLHSTPAQLLAGGCTLVQRNLSWSEWQRYIGKPAYVPTCPELPNHSTAPAQP